jgi:hypothetical protein
MTNNTIDLLAPRLTVDDWFEVDKWVDYLDSQRAQQKGAYLLLEQSNPRTWLQRLTVTHYRTAMIVRYLFLGCCWDFLYRRFWQSDTYQAQCGRFAKISSQLCQEREGSERFNALAEEMPLILAGLVERVENLHEGLRPWLAKIPKTGRTFSEEPGNLLNEAVEQTIVRSLLATLQCTLFRSCRGLLGRCQRDSALRERYQKLIWFGRRLPDLHSLFNERQLDKWVVQWAESRRTPNQIVDLMMDAEGLREAIEDLKKGALCLIEPVVSLEESKYEDRVLGGGFIQSSMGFQDWVHKLRQKLYRLLESNYDSSLQAKSFVIQYSRPPQDALDRILYLQIFRMVVPAQAVDDVMDMIKKPTDDIPIDDIPTDGIKSDVEEVKKILAEKLDLSAASSEEDRDEKVSKIIVERLDLIRMHLLENPTIKLFHPLWEESGKIYRSLLSRWFLALESRGPALL